MTSLSWKGTWHGLAPAGLPHQRARTILRHTGGIVRGKFPSRKTGRMVHHEGLLELDAIYHFETSPLILAYTEQPETIQYPDGNRLRRYTPDFELFLADGSSVLVEIKPKELAAEAETKHKLDRIIEHFTRIGRVFAVLTDQQVRVEPRLGNLRWIYHQAPRIRPSLLKCDVALERLAVHFPASIQATKEVLTPVGLDPLSLLMAGRLTCNLDHPVDFDTQLHLSQEGNHAWFRLSDRFGF